MSGLRKLCDESGQAIIVAAFSMIAVIAILGLAIDIGHFRYAKRNLQIAADSVALASALEVRVCGGTASCPAMQAAAQDALVENGISATSVLTNCSGAPGSGLTIMINNAPCALGASDPNAGKLNYVEAIASQQLQTYFGGVIGFGHVLISARAEAERGLGGPCIYALDPSGPGAISILAGVGVRSDCAIVDE